MKREDSEESLPLSIQNEPNEEEIDQFHTWIEQICDPDITLETEEIFSEICAKISQSVSGQENLKEAQQKSKDLIERLIKAFSDAVFEGNFVKGIAHGFVRALNEFGDVKFWGCFVEGKLHGTCLKTLVGGGFLLSSALDFSGDDMVYLYPDGRTALVGNFQNEKMIKAHMKEVIGTSRACSLNGVDDGGEESVIDGLTPTSVCPCDKLLMNPKFGKPEDVKETTIFSFDLSTSQKISSDPLLRDPYEELFVQLGPSQLPHAGQGLFAKIDITPATVVAFYNGVRIKEDSNNNDANEDVDEDDWTCYRLNLTDDVVIDIPREMVSDQNYAASLGHKICHSFTPNCQFEDFYHPRFGEIKCIVTLTSLAKGEELTANYDYKLADAPVWYKKLWAKHQKQLRKMPDWSTALSCQNERPSSSSSRPYRLSLSSSSASSRTISESKTPDTIPEEDPDSEDLED